ncbi:MAG: acyltransferase family protein [Muribaculaceae bacterium]
MSSNKPRIHYLDFMKGLCILMIVAYHITPNCNIYGGANHLLMSFRVPLYYFLSGLFFKTYNGFADFARRKVNNIVVPFVFFYLMACVLAMICCEVFHLDRLGLVGDSWQWKYLLDPILLNDFHYSNALWFLLSLFEVNIIYYIIQKYLPGIWQYVAIAAVAVAGWLIARSGFMLPMQLDTAMVSLPYFVLGNLFKRFDALTPNKRDAWGYAVLPVALAVLFFTAPQISIHDRILPGFILLYAVSFIAISSLFWFCKNLPKIPIITYIGRYSLIVLGTHSIILGPIRSVVFKIIGESYGSYWAVLGVVIVAELIIIPIMIKLFPKFTAQEELIKARS